MVYNKITNIRFVRGRHLVHITISRFDARAFLKHRRAGYAITERDYEWSHRNRTRIERALSGMKDVEQSARTVRHGPAGNFISFTTYSLVLHREWVTGLILGLQAYWTEQRSQK